MHTFCKWSLVLAVPVAFWAATGRPADNALKPGARMVAEEEVIELLLLRQKSVREDLKIPHEEAVKIFEFTAKQHEEAQKIRNLPEGERKTKFDHMARENEAFLARHLTPEQRKRLEQITMQKAGLMWITRPAIARELELTDEQKHKLREYQQEARAQVMEAIHSANKETRKEKLAELRKATHGKLAGLLTDQQKAKWRELRGAPFRAEIQFEEPESTSPGKSQR